MQGGEGKIARGKFTRNEKGGDSFTTNTTSLKKPDKEE